MVKITPAANDSPAEAAVCTMLFSKIFDFLNKDKTPIDITAAGMEAETVIPAKSPKYALAPAKIIDNTTPRKRAFIVISGYWLLDIIFLELIGVKLGELRRKLQVQ